MMDFLASHDRVPLVRSQTGRPLPSYFSSVDHPAIIFAESYLSNCFGHANWIANATQTVLSDKRFSQAGELAPTHCDTLSCAIVYLAMPLLGL